MIYSRLTTRIQNAPSYPSSKYVASVIAHSVLFKAGIHDTVLILSAFLAALGFSLMNTEVVGKGINKRELIPVIFVSVNDLKELDLVKHGREGCLKLMR